MIHLTAERNPKADCALPLFAEETRAQKKAGII
jgi:hypothetical protein